MWSNYGVHNVNFICFHFICFHFICISNAYTKALGRRFSSLLTIQAANFWRFAQAVKGRDVFSSFDSRNIHVLGAIRDHERPSACEERRVRGDSDTVRETFRIEFIFPNFWSKVSSSKFALSTIHSGVIGNRILRCMERFMNRRLLRTSMSVQQVTVSRYGE